MNVKEFWRLQGRFHTFSAAGYAKRGAIIFLRLFYFRNQQRNPSSDLWDPLWLEATRNAEKAWALLFLHHFLECFRFWHILISKGKWYHLSFLSCKLPSLLCFFFRISATRYIMNGTLIFLLGTPNNNLGPITWLPPWTLCSSQPPNMLVKNLNLLNSPLWLLTFRKRSRPCST